MMKTLMGAEENVEDMYYNTTSAFKHQPSRLYCEMVSLFFTHVSVSL